MPVLPFLAFYLLMMAALMASIVAGSVSGSRLVGALWMLPAAAIFAGFEWWLYRRGEMIATRRAFKWVARGLLAAIVILVGATMAFSVLHSGGFLQ